jgi:hypothetical protein
MACRPRSCTMSWHPPYRCGPKTTTSFEGLLAKGAAKNRSDFELLHLGTGPGAAIPMLWIGSRYAHIYSLARLGLVAALMVRPTGRGIGQEPVASLTFGRPYDTLFVRSSKSQRSPFQTLAQYCNSDVQAALMHG